MLGLDIKVLAYRVNVYVFFLLETQFRDFPSLYIVGNEPIFASLDIHRIVSYIYNHFWHRNRYESFIKLSTQNLKLHQHLFCQKLKQNKDDTWIRDPLFL